MRAVRGETWIALGVIAFGVFLLIQTAAIEVSPGYARVGPRVFPLAISGVLIALGIGLLGEYVGRIYLQVRDRPSYLVQAVIEERRGESS